MGRSGVRRKGPSGADLVAGAEPVHEDKPRSQQLRFFQSWEPDPSTASATGEHEGGGQLWAREKDSTPSVSSFLQSSPQKSLLQKSDEKNRRVTSSCFEGCLEMEMKYGGCCFLRVYYNHWGPLAFDLRSSLSALNGRPGGKLPRKGGAGDNRA